MSNFRPCPLCDNNNTELLYKRQFANKAYDILPEVYNIVCCRKCGFVFDDMDADENDFAKYYSISNKYVQSDCIGSGSMNLADVLRYNNVIQCVKEYLGDLSSSIADVGSGRGGLLKAFADASYNNLTAYDNSPGCVEYIRKNYGFKAFQSDIAHMDATVKYDLVCCCQVFEHLLNPKAVLKSIVSLIKPNGLIYLDVPEATRYAEFYSVPFCRYDVEHINHFSKYHLSQMIRNSGLEIIKFTSMESKFPSGTVMPIVGVLASKQKIEIEINEKSSPDELRNKICLDLQLSENEAIKKANLVKNITGPVCLWGVGAYARGLLKSGAFAHLNIIMLIDKDEQLQHYGQIAGIPIKSPTVLRDKKDITVLVTSVAYSTQICQELKELNFQGNVIVY